jgi:hypothetical protein
MSRNLALKIIVMALTGRKKSLLEQYHLPSVFDNGPTGHDIMNVRMIWHLTAPGVQHAEKAGHIGPDVFLIKKNLMPL